MSMNREAYRLANEIKTELEADGDCVRERLSDVEMKRYETAFLNEVKKEKRTGRRAVQKAACAACAACALLACTAVFSEDVHAAIRQIGWSIGSALGISEDLEDYKSVVNTTVYDQGYAITLQEAVVSNEKLVVNYTLCREDGKPMEEMLTPDGVLYINGRNASEGSSGSAGFLDEGQTVLGMVASYDLAGMDLSGENEYRLDFDRIGFEDGIKGTWSFAFVADGADLIVDTEHVSIGKEFQLPDGVTVTLEEYTANALEQRISYTKSGATRYLLMVKAVDSRGRQVEFGVRSESGKAGYLQNEEIIDDGRIDEAAEWATMTLYAVKLPEGDGQISDDYLPVGEAFELGL